MAIFESSSNSVSSCSLPSPSLLPGVSYANILKQAQTSQRRGPSQTYVGPVRYHHDGSERAVTAAATSTATRVRNTIREHVANEGKERGGLWRAWGTSIALKKRGVRRLSRAMQTMEEKTENLQAVQKTVEARVATRGGRGGAPCL